MLDAIENIITIITETIRSIGPLAGFVIIILESIIPALPLAAFIALNNIVFGSFWGFVISWLANIIGCIVSFYAFRLGFSKKLYRHLKFNGKIHKGMDKISKISLTQLTLLIALPFTPAFLINIASGLSKMKFRKYFVSLILGKIPLIYFWGYIGTSLAESIKDPMVLSKIVILIVATYVVSKVIQKSIDANGGQ